MTIEVVRDGGAQRWVRKDQLNSPNLQCSSMQTDSSGHQKSIGVNCRMGKYSCVFKLILLQLYKVL